MDKIKYNPLTISELSKIQAGDMIERMLAFRIPCYFIVSLVTDDRIYSGGWEFDRKTGLEIDVDIQKDGLESMQISYIRRVLNDDQKRMIQNGAKIIPYEEIKKEESI